MSVIIETNHLVKRYGDILAVDDLSLQVARGEIYAFLGLNGAGKTTTIRMLLGMIKASAGEVRLLGNSVRMGGPKPWHAVGYLVETPHAYPELTVRENLDVVRRLRPGVDAAAVAQTIDRLRLTAYADRRAGTLSLGNLQRVGLAKALLHNPALLILDEPTNGLDPAGIVEIRGLLRQLAHEQGVTIFMSSHLLSEVSRLADRIGILHQGRLVQELDASDLECRRWRNLVIRVDDSKAAGALLQRAGYSAQLRQDNAILIDDTAAIEHPERVAVLLVNSGHAPTHLAVEQEDLEHFFLRAPSNGMGELLAARSEVALM